MYIAGKTNKLANRFRGFLPVVVDVETGGFDAKKDALLEIAAVLLEMDGEGKLSLGETVSTHVIPFEGANLDPKSLQVNGINPFHPLRAAREEIDALNYIFQPIRQAVKAAGCKRAILVGHNASFDLSFINSAAERCGVKRNPFHPFSNFDTVSFSALAFGQTVLSRAAEAAGMPWDSREAHSAVYDTQMTAKLFCHVINRWESLHQP
ncbi:MAG TPA: ribonuclease T [Gammaproteobacteria bacterium]|nr:ribonuclease T [Gammaproteobacteria bacterium]